MILIEEEQIRSCVMQREKGGEKGREKGRTGVHWQHTTLLPPCLSQWHLLPLNHVKRIKKKK